MSCDDRLCDRDLLNEGAWKLDHQVLITVSNLMILYDSLRRLSTCDPDESLPQLSSPLKGKRNNRDDNCLGRLGFKEIPIVQDINLHYLHQALI